MGYLSEVFASIFSIIITLIIAFNFVLFFLCSSKEGVACHPAPPPRPPKIHHWTAQSGVKALIIRSQGQLSHYLVKDNLFKNQS